MIKCEACWAFHHILATILINSKIQEHEDYIYQMALKFSLKSQFWRKSHFVPNIIRDVIQYM